MNNPLAGVDPTGYRCTPKTGTRICRDGGDEGEKEKGGDKKPKGKLNGSTPNKEPTPSGKQAKSMDVGGQATKTKSGATAQEALSAMADHIVNNWRTLLSDAIHGAQDDSILGDLVDFYNAEELADGAISAVDGDYNGVLVSVSALALGKFKPVEKIIEKSKAAFDGKNFAGKQNRNQRLKSLLNDDKVSSSDKGWIKQEINEVAARKKSHIRNPPGKDLAHERGRENAKGYGYEHANLQNIKDHKSQHKLDNWGRKNKERPIE